MLQSRAVTDKSRAVTGSEVEGGLRFYEVELRQLIDYTLTNKIINYLNNQLRMIFNKCICS